jgi:hypothetical protein
MAVGMSGVKVPLLSSMRTRSSPARALTAIRAICLRLKLKSAEPLSPTSTSRMPEFPAFRRSAIFSLAWVPSTVSMPFFSFGRLKRRLIGSFFTAFPAADTGSQRPPKAVSPAPAVCPAFLSLTK